MFGLSRQEKNIALFSAITERDIGRVKKLVEKGADVNCEIMPRLLTTTPLHRAIAEGTTEIVSFLLEKGADPNKIGAGIHGYETPLMLALHLKDERAIDLLIKHGAETQNIFYNVINGFDRFSFNQHHLNLLLRCGCDPDIADGEGTPPLYQAVFAGCLEAVETLLPHIKKIDARCAYDDKTSLETALMKNRPDIATLLLEAGASLTAGEEDPVKLAIPHCPKALPLLLDRGADMTVHVNRMTALHAAAREGDDASLSRLIEAGLDINAATAGEKYTPLMMAALYGHKACIQVLLAAGAKTFLKNVHGQTARDIAKSEQVTALFPDASSTQYVRLDDRRIAATTRLSHIKREITDIFNFEAGERLRLVVNLETKQESHSCESFDRLPGTKELEAALEAFREQGGRADLDAFKSGVLLRPGMRKLP